MFRIVSQNPRTEVKSSQPKIDTGLDRPEKRQASFGAHSKLDRQVSEPKTRQASFGTASFEAQTKLDRQVSADTIKTRQASFSPIKTRQASFGQTGFGLPGSSPSRQPAWSYRWRTGRHYSYIEHGTSSFLFTAEPAFWRQMAIRNLSLMGNLRKSRFYPIPRPTPRI